MHHEKYIIPFPQACWAVWRWGWFCSVQNLLHLLHLVAQDFSTSELQQQLRGHYHCFSGVAMGCESGPWWGGLCWVTGVCRQAWVCMAQWGVGLFPRGISISSSSGKEEWGTLRKHFPASFYRKSWICLQYVHMYKIKTGGVLGDLQLLSISTYSVRCGSHCLQV